MGYILTNTGNTPVNDTFNNMMKTINLYDNSNLQMAGCRKIGIREKKVVFTAAKNVPPLVVGFDTEYVAVRGKSDVPEQGEAPYDLESEDSIGFKPYNEVLSSVFCQSLRRSNMERNWIYRP